MKIRNLSVLSYAQGFTSWHYRAPEENLEEILKTNFFLDAIDMLHHGDLITISCRDGVALRGVYNNRIVKLEPLV